MQQYLKDAVLYQVSGPAHQASGLSCYYPFDSDEDSYAMMVENGLVNSFILTYGLQHGFIDGNTANSMLEAITSEGDDAASSELSSTSQPESHASSESSESDSSEKPEHSSSGGAVDFIANTVNHSVNTALQSLLNENLEKIRIRFPLFRGLLKTM